MTGTAYWSSVLLKGLHEFGVLNLMIARKCGGFLGGLPKKVTDILVYELLQQALANYALLPHFFHC
jgi:hypothetical protein